MLDSFTFNINKNNLSIVQINRIIETIWEDRTTFDTRKFQFNLSEKEVIRFMRSEMKPKSFKLCRKRVQVRKTKHLKLQNF